MIVQCPSCRALVAVSAVILDEGRAGIRCEACGEVSWLPAEGATATSSAAPAPTSRPAPTSKPAPISRPATTSKPGAELPVEACRERLLGLPEVDDGARPLVEAFDTLLERWDDFEEHKRLIQRASLSGQLPVLGVRYRTVLEVRPEEPVARRAQQEILALAMATLTPSAAVDTSGARRYGIVAAAVTSLLFLGIMLWYVVRMLGPT